MNIRSRSVGSCDNISPTGAAHGAIMRRYDDEAPASFEEISNFTRISSREPLVIGRTTPRSNA
jgi:hypothetical protein